MVLQVIAGHQFLMIDNEMVLQMIACHQISYDE